jgi:hypothetical protein
MTVAVQTDPFVGRQFSIFHRGGSVLTRSHLIHRPRGLQHCVEQGHTGALQPLGPHIRKAREDWKELPQRLNPPELLFVVTGHQVELGSSSFRDDRLKNIENI